MIPTDSLVLDANVVIYAATTPGGFEPFRGYRLVGPPLLASEFRAALHMAVWRRDLHRANAERALDMVFNTSAVAFIDDPALGREAWRLADELGWARTYDAEYLALAGLLKCKLVTSDLGIRRGADRTGLVITPQEFLTHR